MLVLVEVALRSSSLRSGESSVSVAVLEACSSVLPEPCSSVLEELCADSLICVDVSAACWSCAWPPALQAWMQKASIATSTSTMTTKGHLRRLAGV